MRTKYDSINYRLEFYIVNEIYALTPPHEQIDQHHQTASCVYNRN